MVVRALALAKSPAVLAKATVPGPNLSFGEIPVDLHRFRTVFPDRWQALLHQHFRGPSHVAVFFDVSEKSARDWWNGITGPHGATALVAVATIPGALQALMGEAA